MYNKRKSSAVTKGNNKVHKISKIEKDQPKTKDDAGEKDSLKSIYIFLLSIVVTYTVPVETKPITVPVFSSSVSTTHTVWKWKEGIEAMKIAKRFAEDIDAQSTFRIQIGNQPIAVHNFRLECLENGVR